MKTAKAVSPHVPDPVGGGDRRSVLSWGWGWRSIGVRAKSHCILELHRLNGELQRMDTARREFLADISHELRTPILRLCGEAEVILRENEGECDAGEYRDTLQYIAGLSTQLGTYVNDLLFLARTELSGNPFDWDLAWDRLDLAERVACAVEDFQAMAREGSITVGLNSQSTPAWVQGDRQRLRQVLFILGDNACRYSIPELFPKTNRKRVLLVEDDGRIVRFVRRGLISEGYDVDVTDSGLEAVELVMECLYQAVILDVGLPDLDGMQVCDNLRACGVDTPILMLTAWNSVRDKVAGLRSGADDYMTKPFVFEELLARIEALARRRTGELRPEPKELRVADLVLNNETREVMRGETLIDLTPKEFAMLECLLRTPGKVLNRMRILEHVRGYSADPMTNVVDVHIRQLRRKIDEHHDKKLLKTVRGFGYKVDAS